MERQTRIPIRIKPRETADQAGRATDNAPVRDAAPAVVEYQQSPPPEPTDSETEADMSDEEKNARQEETLTEPSELDKWRDMALRAQADMENFRRRQQRLADERIADDRERLLRAFLSVVDNLARALASADTSSDALRQGIELTHKSMLLLLENEGAELIQAAGQPFDPNWHEAVGRVSHQEANVPADTIVEVVQPGYRMSERLLRPARVIVAT